MRTIQMTLDDDLLKTVDDIVNELKTTRSAFARDALREAVRRYKIRSLELKHRQGYAAHPVNKEEFSDIASEVLRSKQDGMTKDCAINFDHIQTVSKGKIGSLTTTPFSNKLDQICEAIPFAVDL